MRACCSNSGKCACREYIYNYNCIYDHDFAIPNSYLSYTSVLSYLKPGFTTTPQRASLPARLTDLDP